MKPSNLPNLRPDFFFDFRRRNSLMSAMEVTRASAGTSTLPDGNLRLLQAQQPTIQYENGECLGWLLESAHVNYCAHSSFTGIVTASNTNDTWGSYDINVTDGGVTPYDVVNAKKFTCTKQSGYLQYFSQIAGGEVTFTMKAKKGSQGKTLTLFLCPDIPAINGIGIVFDFDQGTIIGSSNTPSDIYQIVDSYNYITKKLKDGWWEIGITAKFKATTGGRVNVVMYPNSGWGGVGQLGDNVLVCAAQLEVHMFPRTYVPTSGSIATKASESGILNNFPLLQSGTVVVEVSPGNMFTADSTVFSINDPTDNQQDAIDIRYVPTSATFTTRRISNTAQTLNRHNDVVVTPGQVYRVGLSYSPTLLQGAVNGGNYIESVMANATLNLARARLGVRGGTNNPFNGIIRSIAFYGQSVSAEQLKSLTKI